MINKKILLGKEPEELGLKDAVHVAIVSVRAAHAIEPGSRCSLNKDREAVLDNKGLGIVDPWRKETILRGKPFLLMLNQDQVPNVQHHWDHPTVDFSPPTTPVKLNRTIEETAKQLGVTYDQIMEAAQYVVDKERSVPYPGTKTEEEFTETMDDFYIDDFWSEWAGETNYEFEDIGTNCCPEVQYPDIDLFRFVKQE